MDDQNGNVRVTLGALEAQVKGLDRDYQEITRAVSSLNAKLDSAIEKLTTGLDSAVRSLHDKLDAKSSTNWPTIWTGLGVGVAILIGIGGALYNPIQRDTTRLDAAVSTILEHGIFEKQYRIDQARLTAVLDRLDARVADNRSAIAAHEQALRNESERLDAISARLADFIRDISRH
jgi:hypothetical protein